MDALLRRAWKGYAEGLAAIQDSPEEDEGKRLDEYVRVRDKYVPKAQEAAAKMRSEIKSQRQELTTILFGPPRPVGASREALSAANQSYRDAIYKLKNATPEELRASADLAAHIGDTEALRAAAAIGDFRGIRKLWVSS